MGASEGGQCPIYDQNLYPGDGPKKKFQVFSLTHSTTGLTLKTEKQRLANLICHFLTQHQHPPTSNPFPALILNGNFI